MAMKKTTAKKATVKKPVMKSRGTKKPLRKAQNGIQQGPLSEEDTKKVERYDQAMLDRANKFWLGSTPSVKGYNSAPSTAKERAENSVRMSPTFNTSKTNLKTGGSVKKASKKVINKTVKKRK